MALIAEIEKEITTKETKHKGLRLNSGKLRYDLEHPIARKGLIKVLTKGSEKYAPRNWENGMGWSTVIASLKRHLAAFEAGEDYDPETGLLHADHIQCNAHFLSAYYSIYPQGDDRPHHYLNSPNYGLDVDDVLADFIPAWMELWGMEHKPTSWYFDYDMSDRFQKMRDNNTLDDFYLQLKTKIEPRDLPFEPAAYVTSRPVPTEITMEWLRLKGFPLKPVITVPVGTSKVQACRDAGIDIFVDDSYKNFVDLNKNGICCFLFDCEHNQKYLVGHKRITELKQIIDK